MSMQFLHPGEYFFGVPSHVMTTLLGSCVALVAWHPVRHLTLVSHVVLPEIPDGGNVWDPRYADVMMERWLADLRSVGCFPIEFRLGLFGGSSRFYAMQEYQRSVGYRNVTRLERLIDLLGVSLCKQDTGGIYHRKLMVDGMNGCYGVQLLGHPERSIMEVVSW